MDRNMVKSRSPNAQYLTHLSLPLSSCFFAELVSILLLAFSLFALVAMLSQCVCSESPYLSNNPLLLLFKSLLPGQEDCVFISGHLNLHAKPETGIPYREKNYNN
jgi:hypothetical protein